ncbi:hypothetical protein QJS04_geneDACA023057 [Acorus gramineus]|uniref:Uncharacterized protein n=1 Tax=Acorus gramineus TaxID=55184 RepID=A0AAV8ZXT9_ACOGR|nr:hypothetical protein QJS04_geneDACA023057 [Acorus gramineus]
MGLLTYTIAGLLFILTGLLHSHPSPTPTLRLSAALSAALLSSLSLLSSLLSLLNPHPHPSSLPLSLSLLPVSLLFLLHSLLSLLPLPPQLLDFTALLSFLLQLLLFRLRVLDPSGVENRYFDLLLVPISLCLLSLAIKISRPRSPYPRVGVAAGLVAQGTWFIQMGVSFFTPAIAHGCKLHERGRGDFTIRCVGHPEYHRGRAIATLQFDLHLAVLVAAGVGYYALVVKAREGGLGRGRYRVLGEEMRVVESPSRFTLDSDDEDDEKAVEGIGSEANGVEEAAGGGDSVAVVGMNGFGKH